MRRSIGGSTASLARVFPRVTVWTGLYDSRPIRRASRRLVWPRLDVASQRRQRGPRVGRIGRIDSHPEDGLIGRATACVTLTNGCGLSGTGLTLGLFPMTLAEPDVRRSPHPALSVSHPLARAGSALRRSLATPRRDGESTHADDEVTPPASTHLTTASQGPRSCRSFPCHPYRLGCLRRRAAAGAALPTACPPRQGGRAARRAAHTSAQPMGWPASTSISSLLPDASAAGAPLRRQRRLPARVEAAGADCGLAEPSGDESTGGGRHGSRATDRGHVAHCRASTS
jgi:hypothetical protein